jgi:hypothetical protein
MNRFRAGFAAIALLCLAACGSAQELVINGTFANNTAGSTRFNLTNANFNATVASCTAFGTAQETDLIYGTDLGPQPPVGNIKIGLHTQPTGQFDAFSATLNAPVVAGRTYLLQFDTANLNPTAIEVGISNSPTAFGTLCYTAQTLVSWSHVNQTIVVPAGGQYLTFRTAANPLGGYGYVSQVSLQTLTPRIVSLTALPREIRTGQRSEITLTLNRAAGAGGANVNITLSSNALRAPTSVRVPAGARTLRFFVYGLNFGTLDRRVDITASNSVSSASTYVIVHP